MLYVKRLINSFRVVFAQVFKRFYIRFFWLTLAVWLLSIGSASANFGPPQGLVMLGLPFFASLYGFGLGLVLVILLETLILARTEKLSFMRALKFSAYGNLVSTLMGVFFAIFTILSPLMWILLTNRFTLINILLSCFLLLCSILYFLLLGEISAGYLIKVRCLRFAHNPFVWGLIWLLTACIELALGLTITAIGAQHFYMLAFVVYLTVGFGLSVMCEGNAIVDRLPRESQTIAQTIFKMNACSYLYIVTPLTLLLGFVDNKPEM